MTYLEHRIVEERTRLAYWRDRGDAVGIVEAEYALAKLREARAKECALEWGTWEALHPHRPAKLVMLPEEPYTENECRECGIPVGKFQHLCPFHSLDQLAES